MECESCAAQELGAARARAYECARAALRTADDAWPRVTQPYRCERCCLRWPRATQRTDFSGPGARTQASTPTSRRARRRRESTTEAYVMHRLYTQGLVVGILWSGAPDVVARATHKRSALELGARPTGNWRRGAAGLNSPCGESPAAASGAVGRDRSGDRRGRRAAGVKLSSRRESRGATGSWK